MAAENSKRRVLRVGICLVLVLILCVIWGHSLMNGEESSGVSSAVGKFLRQLFPFLDTQSAAGTHILRKCGHFLEFFALGICLSSLFLLLGKKPVWAQIWGMAVACIDESIQLFIPGRSGQFADVILDSCGLAVGICLVCLIHWLKNGKKGNQP